MGCKWVFSLKQNANGSAERFKTRLVAKGYTHPYEIDFQETFAPISKLNTMKILISIAANLDWKLHQLDVKNTFLNGDPKEEVYMETPPGLEEKYNGECKLLKSLYGLK